MRSDTYSASSRLWLTKRIVLCVFSQISSTSCSSTRRVCASSAANGSSISRRSEEHTSELQSHLNLVCRLLLEKKKRGDIFAATHPCSPPHASLCICSSSN